VPERGGSLPQDRGARVTPAGEPPAQPELARRRGAGASLALLRGRLARVTGSGAFVPEIDGLRFVAIALVVLFHLLVNLSIKAPGTFTPPRPGGILTVVGLNGFHGVELFFVISGFVLALPFASSRLLGAPPVGLRPYFLRRLTRLEPPYVLCMVLVFAALVLGRGRSARELLPHLVASLAYLHNAVYGAESLVNNVAWSLEIEVQFYVMVPLLAQVYAIRDPRRRRAVLLAAIAASALASWLLVTPEVPRAYWSLLRFLHLFLLGFLLADIYLVDWRRAPTRSFRWDVISLLGWPALFLLWHLADGETAWGGALQGRASAASTFLFPPAVLLLYVAVFRGRLTNALITNPWLTAIGGMCYTIYLFHNPLLGVLLGATRHLPATGWYALDVLVQALIAGPALLIPCALYFLAIEKPCMRRDWPARLARRLRAAVGAARL
jgi:peptidoglycan/LPS O-acetylase OafA/YrhL